MSRIDDPVRRRPPKDTVTGTILLKLDPELELALRTVSIQTNTAMNDIIKRCLVKDSDIKNVINGLPPKPKGPPEEVVRAANTMAKWSGGKYKPQDLIEFVMK